MAMSSMRMKDNMDYGIEGAVGTSISPLSPARVSTAEVQLHRQ
jgi:hypothetical protein